MNFSSISHNNLCTVMSTVPPPQSNTITTLFFIICSLTDFYASSLHWMEAPSGSRQRRRFWLFAFSIIPAETAAFLINILCSSLHRAGTVNTQRIFANTTLPTCSCNFWIAWFEMYFNVCLITYIRGKVRPSTDFASEFIWRRCILYWIRYICYILEE